jgi:hypothetical protein
MQTTKSTGHTENTTSLTTIETEKIAESTTHGNATIDVTTTTHQSSSGMNPRNKVHSTITMSN